MTKTIRSKSDSLFDKVGTRVIISRDKTALDPISDEDTIFQIHSFISRDFSGNEKDKEYVSPFDSIKDDGVTLRKDVIAFPVDAYIHGAITLAMSQNSNFPDKRWDVAVGKIFVWTDKNIYETMYGPWMSIYDEELKKFRPAKDMKEFKKHLFDLASEYLTQVNDYLDGNVWRYWVEHRVKFTKVYRNRKQEEGFEYEVDYGEEGSNIYQDKNGKLEISDAPRSADDSIEWFSDDVSIIGDTYEVEE